MKATNQHWRERPGDSFLKVYELVQILGTSRQQVYRLIHTIKLPAVAINGQFYVAVCDMKRFLQSRKVGK